MRKGGIRVGLASKLRLEIGIEDLARLPGPISAELDLDSEGRVVATFRNSSNSPYSWGALNQEYKYHQIDIPFQAVTVNNGALDKIKFTFTKPESVRWENGKLVARMPSALLPPRRSSKSTPKKSVKTSSDMSLEDLVRALNEALENSGGKLVPTVRDGKVRILEELS